MGKLIIHINGVQGSGKSYICSRLKNILCVDTDDIMKQAIKIIEQSQKTKHKLPKTFKQLQKVKKSIVNKYITKHNRIVFVGMTADIPNPNYKFFIKITNKDAVFRRLLLRELNKIVSHYNQLKKHIQTEPDPNEIECQRIAELSVMFPVEYKMFVDDYNENKKKAIKNKYSIKTQDEIIQTINKL
jgi:adenylate kinase family enzyme